jgi:hypothetical protein
MWFSLPGPTKVELEKRDDPDKDVEFKEKWKELVAYRSQVANNLVLVSKSSETVQHENEPKFDYQSTLILTKDGCFREELVVELHIRCETE